MSKGHEMLNVELVDEDAPEFFAPVASDLIDGLLGQYQAARKNIAEVATFVRGPKHASVIHYFLEGNSTEGRGSFSMSRSAEQLFDERVCAYSQERRARLALCDGVLREEEIKWLMASQKYKCVVCHAPIHKSFHADHIIPLSKGGDNLIKNIQLLCPKCNLQKGAKHPTDFMQSKGYLL